MTLRALVAVALTSSVGLCALPAAHAAPITSITQLNNFRDTRGLNDVGIGRGDFNQFGADRAPHGHDNDYGSPRWLHGRPAALRSARDRCELLCDGDTLQPQPHRELEPNLPERTGCRGSR
jgi:hypothetical protein